MYIQDSFLQLRIRALFSSKHVLTKKEE